MDDVPHEIYQNGFPLVFNVLDIFKKLSFSRVSVWRDASLVFTAKILLKGDSKNLFDFNPESPGVERAK